MPTELRSVNIKVREKLADLEVDGRTIFGQVKVKSKVAPVLALKPYG